jgi:hypothetical protein
MKNFRIIEILLLLILLIAADCFSRSNGLVTEGGGVYVTEFLSSGSDDNIVIEFSRILLIPMAAVSLIRIRKRMNLFEYILYNMILLTQAIFLFAIEAGSIISTVFIDHNIPLMIWFCTLIVLACFIQIMFFGGRRVSVKRSAKAIS